MHLENIYLVEDRVIQIGEQHVIIDADIAELYGVETGILIKP